MTKSRTIDALLVIMDDTDVVTRRRIEAAEQLLDFEAPDEAVIRAREYLVSVFENSDEELADRMNAIRASRKVEAAKVSPKVVHLNRRTPQDRKEAWRSYELSQLRTKIILATRDVPPKGWDDVLTGPDYLPPEGDEWPPWFDEKGQRR
jgi:ParB-like chromosome segregation protein Spo0J